jgi:hypothetical protein
MNMNQTLAIFMVGLTFTAMLVPSCFAAGDFEASSAIDEAEFNLKLAFAEIAKAENVGADIEEILAQLEVAGDSLSNAYSAFRAGDYEAAISFALECNKSIEAVATEADRLLIQAETMKTDSLVFNMFWSSVALALLLVFSIVGWRMLKKYITKRVLEMRPEVEEAV